MKKIFTLFLIFTSFFCFSQNVTLNELLSLRKKDVAGVDEYLTTKKWEFIEAEEPGSKSLGMLSYAYKKNYDDTAESFLNYFYSDYSGMNRILIQISNKSVLNSYINQIKAWGGKLYNSYVEDGNIVKIYRGSTITYKFLTSIQDNNFGGRQTIYILSIYTNDDFDSL